MVRKSREKTTRDDGRKARAAVSWLWGPKKNLKCPMLEVANKFSPRNQFVNLLRTALVQKD